MNCTNINHHVDNGDSCSQASAGSGMSQSHNPHDMHWHINKNSFKGWGLNFVYFALHAVQIYLILRLVK
jgi:hypothetical protein